MMSIFVAMAGGELVDIRRTGRGGAKLSVDSENLTLAVGSSTEVRNLT